VLLEAAEGRLDTARLDKDAARLERREALGVARAELDKLGEALGEIQARCDRSDPLMTSAADAAQACAGRLARSLAQALDPEDLRGEHHDIGGSG